MCHVLSSLNSNRLDHSAGEWFSERIAITSNKAMVDIGARDFWTRGQ